MKKIIITAVFALAFFLQLPTAYALEAEDFDLFTQSDDGETSSVIEQLISGQLESLNLSDFDEFLTEEEGELLFSGGFYQSVQSLIAGEFFADGQTFFGGVCDVFFGEIKSLIPTFIAILASVILLSVLANFTSDFLKEDMQNLLGFAIVLAVCCLSMPIILQVTEDVQTGISALSLQAESGFPILITLVYALGGSASATCFSPMLYILSNVILKLVAQYILPAFLFILGVNIINALSQSLNFSQIADFFLSVCKYVLGITFTIFSASMALGGISAGSFDSISYRTAKYAISNSVPVIGAYVRDGFDLILFSGVLIKNAVGVGFVILAFVAIIAPLSRLVGVIFLFKLTAALSSAFAPKQVLCLFGGVQKSLSLIAVAYIAVFFMYSIAIIMLIISTNILI